MSRSIVSADTRAGRPELGPHESELPIANVPQNHEAQNLSVSEARDLLDWLEAHGIQADDVETNPAGLLTVRWAG